MNEIQLIRQQLETERRRASEVAEACVGTFSRAGNSRDAAAARAQFLDACVEYLVSVLTRFEGRDQRLSDLWETRLAATDPQRRTLEELLSGPGASCEALERLEAAVSPRPARSEAGKQRAWEEFAQFFRSAWSVRRAALDALFEANARTADWRSVGGIDADAILEERERYARVQATLPAGVSLVAPRPKSAARPSPVRPRA